MPTTRLPAFRADASALVATHGAGGCAATALGGDGKGPLNAVAPEGAAPAGDTSWFAHAVSPHLLDLAAPHPVSAS